MDGETNNAPGWPGIPARWTSSAKSGIGKGLKRVSRVWFTLSHGILNEIYYPRADLACTRDMGLIVTDGGGLYCRGRTARCPTRIGISEIHPGSR
jgi:glucoamylase